MEFQVRLFLDGMLVEPSDYSKVVIANPSVDRIVNDIYETSMENTTPPAAEKKVG